MDQHNSRELENLLDEVEAVFRKTEDQFKFTVESFQHALTARDVYQQISGERLTIAEFYDFIGDRRAIANNGDYLTENWRKVVSFLIPMLQDSQSPQLAEVIFDDPVINSIANIGKMRLGKAPIIVNAHNYICNADAHFIMARVYEHLATTYGMSLICVEGADDEVDTEWFRSFPDDNIKKEVAEYFVKKGEITAPELFCITTERPPVLYGLEKKEYYLALLDFETGKGSPGSSGSIWDVAKKRGEAMLRILNEAIDKYLPKVVVVEYVSQGLYSLPNLSGSTDYTVIGVSPKVKGGINWELYHKVIRGESTPFEELFIKNVA